MVLIIDNYDSFVENLARYVRELGYATTVYRNDKISIEQMRDMQPSHIIISPGPRTPNEAGISLELIKTFTNTIPILGVCLGHQAIGQAFDWDVKRAVVPMHGKSSVIQHNGTGIFANIKNPLTVARYHSLIVTPPIPAVNAATSSADYVYGASSTSDSAAMHTPNANNELIVTATSIDGEIMALQHYKNPTFGVQFHPESILTECGYQLLQNFCNYASSYK